MVAKRDSEPKPKKTPPRPATTPEGRENQLIAAAVDLAERQILDGTASAQVITHFLKAGSSREKLEKERLAHENELTRVKIENAETAKATKELYERALAAMGIYSGQRPVEVSDNEQD